TVRSTRMADGCDVDEFLIGRIDPDPSDLSRLGKTHVDPRAAGVGGPVDTVAGRQVSAQTGLAHADVDDGWIRLSDGDCADRPGAEEPVGDVAPGPARIFALPHAAAGGAHVIDQRLRGDTRHGSHASAAIGADAAPFEGARRIDALLAVDRLNTCRDDEGRNDELKRSHTSDVHHSGWFDLAQFS